MTVAKVFKATKGQWKPQFEKLWKTCRSNIRIFYNSNAKIKCLLKHTNSVILMQNVKQNN